MNCLVCNELTKNNKFCSRKCAIFFRYQKHPSKLSEISKKSLIEIFKPNSYSVKDLIKYCEDNHLSKKVVSVFLHQNKHYAKRPHMSEAHKDKIRQMRRNPKIITGWEKKQSHQMSYPEELFANLIIENKLFEKYDIVNELYVEGRHYLDFAFVNIKLDVEIDGKQHLTPEAILHDIERDKFLRSHGWNVYRILASNFIKNRTQIFKSFLSDLESHAVDKKNYDVNTILKGIEMSKIKWQQKQLEKEKIKNEIKRINLKKNYDKVNDLICKSNIDFNKNGWVKETSKFLDIRHQKVKEWMKTYCPEFYETCKKRKSIDRTKYFCLNCNNQISKNRTGHCKNCFTKSEVCKKSHEGKYRGWIRKNSATGTLI